MIYLYSFGLIFLGLVMVYFVGKARDAKLSKNVSKEELIELRFNHVTEEDLRIKHSSGWLNFLSFLSFPLFLSGIILIIYNLWQLNIFWVKVILIYFFIGLLIATNHVKNVGIGAVGIEKTFLGVSIGWPIVLVGYLIRKSRLRR
ncbi:MAG: hypothetical protein WDZ80_00950 [Candidatus Paceibacterota bacterium]